MWFDNLINEKELENKEEYMFYEGQIKAHKEKCYIINCPCQTFDGQNTIDDANNQEQNENFNKIETNPSKLNSRINK